MPGQYQNTQSYSHYYAILNKSGQLCRDVLLADSCDGVAGELITTFVIDVSGMTFQPLPNDLVFANQSIERAPEIFVFHGFLVRRLPAAPFPRRKPFGNAIAQVNGVGEQFDFARFVHGGKRANGGLQFHPVVRGGGFGSADFFQGVAATQHRTPAARPGISFATAIGMNRELFQSKQD